MKFPIPLEYTDRLTDSQKLALARFLAGCARVRNTFFWRAVFDECVRRDSYLPFVPASDQQHLRELVSQQGVWMVLGIRTHKILQAANEAARRRGEPEVVIECPSIPARQHSNR